MIVEAIYEAKAKKIKQYPVNSNRASDLGHECRRYLVFNRMRWREKTLHDARLQLVFDMGNAVETMCENDLREAGFSIVEQHRPFQWDKYHITGHIDLKLSLTEAMIREELESGKSADNVKQVLQRLLNEWLSRTGNVSDFVAVVPAEIKSAAPHVWQGINTIGDIKSHKYHYMRKYPAQLTLYLLMDGKELGVFLFKNKQTGEPKEIWMLLDYEYAETIITKAEGVNAFVAAYETTHALPDPMPYDEDICTSCGFNHICLPERIGKEVEVIDDERLIELLAQREKLMSASKEYDHVEKELKALIHGRDKLLAGDWFITGKWIDKATYDVPDAVKAQYKGNKPYWKPQFIKTTAEAPKVEE